MSIPRVPQSDRLHCNERLVVKQAVTGLTNDEIAQELGITCQSVANRMFRAMSKLGVRNRTELALKWWGLSDKIAKPYERWL